MRYTIFTAMALSLTAATAFGQQPSGRNSAKPQREQRQESDSSFIAREWAAWNALKAADERARLLQRLEQPVEAAALRAAE